MALYGSWFSFCADQIIGKRQFLLQRFFWEREDMWHFLCVVIIIFSRLCRYSYMSVVLLGVPFWINFCHWNCHLFSFKSLCNCNKIKIWYWWSVLTYLRDLNLYKRNISFGKSSKIFSVSLLHESLDCHLKVFFKLLWWSNKVGISFSSLHSNTLKFIQTTAPSKTLGNAWPGPECMERVFTP